MTTHRAVQEISLYGSQDNSSPERAKRRGGPLLLWGLALSVLLHVLVLGSKMGWLDFSPPPKPPPEPIEITDYTPPPPALKKATPAEKTKAKPPVRAKEKEIVETEDAKNRKIDPNAKFLSEHDQTAEKQMRAKAIDDFREKQGTGMKSDKAPSPRDTIAPTADSQAPTKAPQPTPSPEGEKAIEEKKPTVATKTQGVKRDWKTLSLKDLSVGDNGPTAASDDRASGVDQGDRTILSTREFKFFSYYRRIKELLRQYWKPTVEAKLYHMWARGKQVNEDELTTQLLVMLDGNGAIQKISKLGSSGIADLDDAAIEAFQKAAPFPNPPKGMVDTDGFVRIRWDFILKAETGPVIQFRNVGSVPPGS